MKKKLRKRNCNIKMEIKPDAGWFDIEFNIENDSLNFQVSYALGDSFNKLLHILYHFYPDNNDPEFEEDVVCYKAIRESMHSDNIIEITEKIPDNIEECLFYDVPYKVELYWDEEGSYSKWIFEREPTLDTDFMIKIDIFICRGSEKYYSYKVRYKDLCYAVAKGCTEVVKSYGIYGYHKRVYEEDMNLRYLLFLKSVALDNFEARELNYDKKNAPYSSLEKELELLMFDM